jgi:hypothetical protein
MRTFVFVVALLSVSLGDVRPAHACSCMPPGSDEDEAKTSDAVFVGTATSVTTAGVAQFAVTSAIKGVRAGSTVTVAGGGICGFTFARGKRYKVFADKNAHGVLEASLCSATRAL